VSLFVLKVGGAVAESATHAVSELAFQGHEVVLVHGAGPQITAEMQRLRLPLGLVGDPLPAAPAAVVEALERGLVPVVAPLARGPLNVNGDEAAVALALGLGAERVVFLTDVPGVLVEGAVAERIGATDAERLAASFEGGIVPKLLAAARAARGGVPAEIGVTAVTA
jgi:acetylglutamate kinase